MLIPRGQTPVLKGSGQPLSVFIPPPLVVFMPELSETAGKKWKRAQAHKYTKA
jgi:hypothetical protein